MQHGQLNRGSHGTSEHFIRDAEQMRREAENTAEQLLNSLANMKYPWEAAIKAVSNETSLNILSAEETAKWATKERSRALTLAKEVPPAVALPTLLKAATAFYYEPHHEELQDKLPWLGTALKSAFGLVWPNVFVGNRSEKLRVGDLRGLVCATAVWEQLENLRLVHEVSGQGAVTMTGDGLRPSQEMAQVIAETYLAFGERGRLHRTLHDSIKLIIAQPASGLQAIQGILRGENPENQQIFKATIFGRIPREPEQFWAGLWARFHLLFLCRQCSLNPYDLAVFPDIGISWCIQQELPVNLLQRVTTGLFWNRRWYESRAKQGIWNMIVERPVTRISYSPGLFVATFLNVCDSLTWFVEASIMAYPESGGVRLPGSVFMHHVSATFEENAVKIFRKHGYKAGKVTEDGVWILETGKVHLEHRYGEKCPGEIDILAYDPKRNLAFVADCKVLAYPISIARMRNLIAKINDQDTEKFHSKLKKKVKWILSVQGLGHRQDDNTVGMLILDRRLLGMAMATKNLVCDLATLDGILAELPS